MISSLTGFLPDFVAAPVLAAMAEKPSLLESEGFILVGFLLVLAVLFLLYLICLVLGFFFVRHERQLKALAVTAQPATPAASPSPPVDSADDDQRLAAVIAAAVHVTLGSSARVLKINPILSDEWAREGRRRHFASHKLR